MISVEKLKTRTLQSIFVEYGIPREFELLSIDVEDHDLEVLRSVNLMMYQPRLIVIEMLDFSFENIPANDICAHLARYGYTLVAYNITNGYFLRKELI